PGAVQLEPNFMQNDAPQAAFVLGAIFLVVVLLPISVAFARRIWRRSSRGPATADVSHELDERFTRLEQGMDAIAVEVERVGESQRFMTRVFTEERDGRAIGAGAAEPISVRNRDAAEIRR
ncbi:MAG: hypothetical protein ABIZ91_02740, partial [Gemmatimonadaceae bacterium]